MAESPAPSEAGSQTAADFIKEQLTLEAEAREALPYQFDTCSRPLGAIRQNLFSCLTCNPPPADSSAPYSPAGVCYSCSISCHGEHTLVELFGKRNFECDCGTTRIPESSPCTLRLNSAGHKGDVTGEEPNKSNKYNQNFRNVFCGCIEEYDALKERGTMFQCLGLGAAEEGGCGEDWWHPECLVGLSREEYKKLVEKAKEEKAADVSPKKIPVLNTTEANAPTTEQQPNGHAAPGDAHLPSVDSTIAAEIRDDSGVDGNDVVAQAEEEDDDTPLPQGFPQEDDFEHFICYKCVEAHPWIKEYAGSEGFLPPIYTDAALHPTTTQEPAAPSTEPTNGESKKRKAEDDAEDASTSTSMAPPKRQKSEDILTTPSSIPETTTLPITPEKEDFSICKLTSLTSAPITNTPFSLFLKPDFRDHICHCASCFPLLKPHPQLLEEEDTYEPPVSEEGNENPGSVGTGSIYDRGEAAFSTMDRVHAIQGAMAYAQLKDNLKAFLQPFAENKTPVGAEDIKAYFEKLRGDDQGIKDAAGGAKKSKGDDEKGDGGDGRREQSGY